MYIGMDEEGSFLYGKNGLGTLRPSIIPVSKKEIKLSGKEVECY